MKIMDKAYEGRESSMLRDLRVKHPEYFPILRSRVLPREVNHVARCDEWENVCQRRKDKDPLMRGGRSVEYRFSIGFPYAEDGTKLRRPTEHERKWSARREGNKNSSLAWCGIETRVPHDNDEKYAEERKKKRVARMMQFTRPVIMERKGGF